MLENTVLSEKFRPCQLGESKSNISSSDTSNHESPELVKMAIMEILSAEDGTSFPAVNGSGSLDHSGQWPTWPWQSSVTVMDPLRCRDETDPIHPSLSVYTAVTWDDSLT